MKKSLNTTEKQQLETYRIALENVTAQPVIKQEMNELGYDEEKITEGKQLYQQTLNIWGNTQTEHEEQSLAYIQFDTQRKELGQQYRKHRKRAKVVFRKDTEALQRLFLTGILDRTYLTWLETIKNFYKALENNTQYKQELLKFKITEEELQKTTEKIQKLEQSRANYIKEKGESQEATQQKDQAMATLSQWMRDFYAIAEIALEEQPQLLEALNKVVKS